ncbi:MAG: cache domain-containing protein [Chloroflexota bacterium]
MLLSPRSLRTKIIAWSFIPTTIILIAVALVSLYAYQRITEDLVTGRNRELTRLSASKLSTELREYTDLLGSVSRTEISEQDPGARRRALERASGRLVIFDGGVVILDTKGNVVAAEPERPEVLGQDWSVRPYFQHLYQTSGPAFADIATDGPQGADVVAVAVPVLGRQGEFAGAIVGMFRVGASNVSALYGGFVKQRIEETGVGYVVDGNGRVIFHTDPDRVGEDQYGQAVVRNVLAGRVGDMRLRDLQGYETLASYAPIPGTSWGLVTEQSWEALMASSQIYRWLLFGLLALGVVLPALVVTFGANRLTRPIDDLIEASQYVAAGHFGRKIEAATGDEIEELAEQFNLMSAQLQQSYSKLEERVAARTRELATVNAITATVSRSLDLDEVLHEAMEAMLEVARMDAGAAYGLDESEQSLSLSVSKGLSGNFSGIAAHLSLDAFTAWQGDALLTPASMPLESVPFGPLQSAWQAESLPMIVVVPLLSRGRMLGVICFGARELRQLSRDELNLLGAIGQQVAIATENARLYEQAERSAAAAERNRLARDLHDAVSQTLFSASLIAEVLPRLWERNPEEARRRLGELRQLTRGALAEMRTLLHELRPNTLTEAPFGELLRQLCEATTGRSRIPVALTVHGDRILGPDLQVGLYRIVQEALNNVAKHAGAEHATVEVMLDETGVELAIGDDGRGFDASAVTAEHLGLRIMRERAEAVGASLTISSAPGEGTEVSVVWRDPATVATPASGAALDD